MTPDPVPVEDVPAEAPPAPSPRSPRTNRVVAWVTAALTLVLALVPVIGNLDFASTAGIIAGIGAVAAVALKWLSGWQQYEAAAYQADLTGMKANAQLAVLAAEEEAAAAVGGRRSAPKVQVPRR
jgi:hypothetical protein